MMTTETNVLIHHGIKGQKWGVRRFQNEDGSRTKAGLAHDRKLYAENNDSDSDSSSGRKGLTEGQKQALKTVGKVALAAAAVGATAYLYSQNKEAIDGAIKSMSAQLTNKLPTEIESSGRSFVQRSFDDAQKSIAKNAERREAVKKVADKALGAVIGAKDSTTSAVKNVASTAAGKAKDVASTVSNKASTAAAKAGKSVKTASSNAAKSAGAGFQKAAKSAEDKATAYLVTRTIEKASERNLQKKQEKNRHKEEMARIKRGGRYG